MIDIQNSFFLLGNIMMSIAKSVRRRNKGIYKLLLDWLIAMFKVVLPDRIVFASSLWLNQWAGK